MFLFLSQVLQHPPWLHVLTSRNVSELFQTQRSRTNSCSPTHHQHCVSLGSWSWCPGKKSVIWVTATAPGRPYTTWLRMLSFVLIIWGLWESFCSSSHRLDSALRFARSKLIWSTCSFVSQCIPALLRAVLWVMLNHHTSCLQTVGALLSPCSSG